MTRLRFFVLTAITLTLCPRQARANSFWKTGADVAAVSAAATGSIIFLALEGQPTMDEYHRRASGDPVLPDLRLDQSYQAVGTAAQGSSSRVQAGYAILGVDGEYLHYWERNPTASLDYWQAEALLRLSDSPSFRADLAYGYRGEATGPDSMAAQGGISMGAYFDYGIGLETDLRWADLQGTGVFGDGRVRALWRILDGHLSVFGGYRALRVADGHRDGPEGGLTLTW